MVDSPYAKYLRLLDAQDVKVLENRVVDTILGAVRRRRAPSQLPVKLSSVAKSFSISPVPHLRHGHHDGQIEYEERTGQFVITLSTPFPDLPLHEQPNRTRMRFTYAHEVAHRFFFVNEQGKWLRALDVATSGLSLAEEMKQKITLTRVEEGLCNSIARRVLIPDIEVSTVDLSDWFGKGPEFIQILTATAQKFGVSRDCLLVRLRRSRIKGSNAAFLVSRSRGTVNERGALSLRVATWLYSEGPGSVGIEQLRPGLEWSKFGDTASVSVEAWLRGNGESKGEFEIPLEFAGKRSVTFRGWWSLLDSVRANTDANRILLWGSLS